MSENQNDWNANEDVDKIANETLNSVVEEETELLPTDISPVDTKFEIIDFTQEYKDSLGTKTTLPILTKYEKARIIGQRASQIARNMPAMISTKGLKDDIQIAEKELEAKKTPMIVRRLLPDGTHEDWRISEFLF